MREMSGLLEMILVTTAARLASLGAVCIILFYLVVCLVVALLPGECPAKLDPGRE